MAVVGNVMARRSTRWIPTSSLSYTVAHVGEPSCVAMCRLYLRLVAPVPTPWLVLEPSLYRWKTVGRCGMLAWRSSASSLEGAR